MKKENKAAETKVEKTPIVEETVEISTPPAQPELTINDLSNARQVIDLAVRRGAFSASEASSVGSVFDKLNAFLNGLAAAQQAQEEPKQQ